MAQSPKFNSFSCRGCKHWHLPANQDPCWTCSDVLTGIQRRYEPAEEGARVVNEEAPRGKATGITPDDLKTCALCEGKFHPVSPFTDGKCGQCYVLDQLVRHNPVLVKKILREINKEVTHGS